MRLAALYDIHGNLPALEAVLEDVRRAKVDAVVVGGDVVPGPMPTECLARLRAEQLPIFCIHGNGEREILAWRRGEESAAIPWAYRGAMRWVALTLTDADAAWLAGWPSTLTLPVDGIGDAMFCHASPRNDTDIFTRETAAERVRPLFAGVSAPVVVCGHTHMAFDRMIDSTRVVNAGSVGMPFAEPGAYWLELGPDVTLRRTAYDTAAAARLLTRSAYPGAAEFAERYVARPPTEVEMLAAYSRIALAP